MPESVKRRGSSGPTIGAMVGLSCFGSVAIGDERIFVLFANRPQTLSCSRWYGRTRKRICAKGGREMLRVLTGGEDAAEIAMPPYVRARAEEIAALSRRLDRGGTGFRSSRDVLAPALVYGLAHMQERYRQAALRQRDQGPEPRVRAGSG